MMRSWSLKVPTGLALMVVMATSAIAQPAQSGVTLAGHEAVQKELAMTDEQIAKVKILGEEARAEEQASRDEAHAGLLSLPRNERRAKLAELMPKRIEIVAVKYRPKLGAILDAKQIERLDQIILQVAGLEAYSDPTVAKALNLTQDQQDKLALINKETLEKGREVFGTRGMRGDEDFAKAREMYQAREKNLAAVLTANQGAAFARLKGKGFNVSQLRRSPLADVDRRATDPK